MALFRKNKQTTTNIPELQEYYANQQKESAGKAWLLAVGSLLITVVILVGAFFGGRWLYRQVTKKDKPSKATTSQLDKAGSTFNTDSSTKDSSTSNSTSTDSTSTTDSATSTSTSTATNNTSTTAPGVATTQSTATNQAATSASTTSLPNTGPASTLSIFVIVMVSSYVLHRTYTSYKINK